MLIRSQVAQVSEQVRQINNGMRNQHERNVTFSTVQPCSLVIQLVLGGGMGFQLQHAFTLVRFSLAILDGDVLDRAYEIGKSSLTHSRFHQVQPCGLR